MTENAPFFAEANQPALRTLAGQGDFGAMTILLQQALSHKNIQLEAELQNKTLSLRLNARSTPDQRITTILICREIVQWQSLDSVAPLERVVLEGKSFTAETQDWHCLLAIAPSEYFPTIHQAASGLLGAFPPVTAVKAASSLQPLDRMGWQAIGAGLFLALLVLASQQVTFLLSPLITLVHELGHTCFSWGFGYPAIPAFDFVYGGGVTMQSAERVTLILGLIYSAFGYLFYRYWHNHWAARLLLALCLGYTLCAFTPLHELLIIGMGHGFELVFAGIFLYRAVSGVACHYSIERPLYAMLSFYLVAYDIRFTFGLLFDPDLRDLYSQGKGGILDNDLTRIAQDYLKTDLSVVAILLMLLTLLLPTLTILLYRYRPLGDRFLFRLWGVRSQP